MRANQDSNTSLRALSLLLVILLLVILVASMLLVASEHVHFVAMLYDSADVLSDDAGSSRVQAGLRLLFLLGVVTLPVAVILVSIISRGACLREYQYAAELEQQQSEIHQLRGAANTLTERQRTQAVVIDEANEQINAAAKTCREVAQRLLDGSRFETAHLLAAGGSIAEAATVMDEMAEHAEASAAVAKESMQMTADETNMQQAFYYLADLSRRMAQVSQRLSGSVAGVGKSIESISEISRRSAESAAVLSSVSDDLKKLAEKQSLQSSVGRKNKVCSHQLAVCSKKIVRCVEQTD
jgi:DNA-binding ferritin-like protein